MRPSGSAPTQARLALHSSTASTAPRYGSQATRRPLPSIETAIADAGRQLQHRGVGGLGPAHGARADEAVVLLERPAAGGEVGAAQEREQQAAGVGGQTPDRLGRRVHRHARGDRLEVVDRALVDERGDRHVADERVAVEHPQAPRGGDLADRGRVDEPLLAHRHDLVDLAGLDDAQHPLLRLRDHDLEGLHVGLAQRDLADVEVQADLALARHLGARRGQAGRAEVLQRDEQPALEQLERALEQLLLLERVADLDGGALGGVELVELAPKRAPTRRRSRRGPCARRTAAPRCRRPRPPSGSGRPPGSARGTSR